MPEKPAPEQIEPRSLGDYLDVMSKAVFQSGISWKVVEAKWSSTREAFNEFDVEKVANLNPDDIDELAQDTRVIRNRRKLEAIIGNANRMIELEGQVRFVSRLPALAQGLRRDGEVAAQRFQVPGRYGMLLLPLRRRRASAVPR